MARTKKFAQKSKKAVKSSHKKSTPHSVVTASPVAATHVAGALLRKKLAIENLTKGRLAIESGDYLDAFDLTKALNEILGGVYSGILEALAKGLDRYSGKKFYNTDKYQLAPGELTDLEEVDQKLARTLFPHFCKLREAVDEVNSAIEDLDWHVSAIADATGHSK